MSLQTELEQILDQYGRKVTENGYLQEYHNETLKAILATVSKHLPEKVKDRTGKSPEGKTYHTKNGSWVTSEDYGRNTAITEMEKTLGADHE